MVSGILRSTRNVGLLAGFAVVAMLALGGGSASAATDGTAQVERAQANCQSFARANAGHIAAEPAGFCGCLVDGVRQSFAPANAAAIIDLMATMSPDGPKGWAWWRPETLGKALDGAQDARAVSGEISTGLTRCSVGEGYVAPSQTAPIMKDGVVVAALKKQSQAHCVSAMQAHGDKVPDPGAMCGCMIEQVDARFSPREAAIVIAAMADIPPMAGRWEAWTRPGALRAAGHMSGDAAAALSHKVRKELGPGTQRQCAAVKSGGSGSQP